MEWIEAAIRRISNVTATYGRYEHSLFVLFDYETMKPIKTKNMVEKIRKKKNEKRREKKRNQKGKERIKKVIAMQSVVSICNAIMLMC